VDRWADEKNFNAMMMVMERTVPFLNACVSFVVFITTVTLVIYMLIAFVTGVFDVVQIMRETVLLDPTDRQLIFKTLNTDFLHNIAILLILMKAYRILVEYMRYHHIDLKFMVEITIIACVLELLFNFQHYTPDMRLVLLGLGVTFLGFYAFKYDTFVKSSLSTQQTRDKADAKNHTYSLPETTPISATPKTTTGTKAKPKTGAKPKSKT
jgi:uncharacterized membrane protein (DUF373 family)